MYDTIVIGGGMAGLAAALYAQRREMKTLLLTRDIGGQIGLAGEIENYLGFDLITGLDLNERLEKQAKYTGYEIRLEAVTEISGNGTQGFTVNTSQGSYRSRTVIFALGLVPRYLGVPGEKEFAGKGVSYCANCDGQFFRGKRLIVVGGGNSALDAAEVLSKIAAEVHLVHRSSEFKAFESLVSEVKARPNINIRLDSEIVRINGDTRVTSAVIKHSPDGALEELPIDGVFVEIGHKAQSDLVANLVKLDAANQIIVNEACETSQPGIFAAGDITQIRHKQLTVASGQGTIAALSAYEYVRKSKAAS
ncbi:MAG: FAD-dependent oxidoreductase [Patescibacteria group bacterium]